jgi:branched-chain amino acid transport system permease protein/urea transport system permease protein
MGLFTITILNAISISMILILISLGLAIIFGLRGIINLAHTEFFMLGAYVVVLADQIGLPVFWAGLVLSPIAVGFVGWLIERSLIRFLYERPIETLLGTWGVSLVLKEGVKLVLGPQQRYTMQPFSGSWTVLGVNYPIYRIFIIFVTLVVICAMVYLFLRTDFGLRTRAVIANREMASAVGINTSLIDQSIFALGAGLAGLAGAIMSPVVAVNPNMGLEYFARTFFAVIVGGVNNVFGVLVGGAIIGSGEAFLSAAFRPVVAQILVLVLSIVVVRVRPQGVVGKSS